MKSSPEGMDFSLKTCAIELELLTDTAISTGPRVSGGFEDITGRHGVQLVSANLKGASNLSLYL